MAIESDNISIDISLNEAEINLFLMKYFSYYATLNENWKKLFCKRVLFLSKTKTFTGLKGFIPNNQVKAIISASAVQLTLGLEVWDLHYFDRILIFPVDFLNKESGQKLKGETRLSGSISLSWKSFIEGYKIKDDNLNLGIHEFTHALRFNGIRSDNIDYFFSNYFSKWHCIGNGLFVDLKEGRPSIFRPYGGANINEFLSVVVEHFFESPQQFKTELPLFYSATAVLLNQRYDGKTTEIAVREEELNSQPLRSELPELNSNVSFHKSTSAYIGLVFLVLGLFTLTETGLFSFPSLFLFGLGFINLILSDLKYCKAIIEPDKISVFKGYALFKNRKRFTVALSHLTETSFYSESSNDEAVMLTFLNNDGFFYEETVHLNLQPEQKQDLISALRKNYVWVKEST